MEQVKTLPQLAYEAYAAHQGWVNYQGLSLPPWREVRKDIQEAWMASVNVVIVGTTVGSHSISPSPQSQG